MRSTVKTIPKVGEHYYDTKYNRRVFITHMTKHMAYATEMSENGNAVREEGLAHLVYRDDQWDNLVIINDETWQ